MSNVRRLNMSRLRLKRVAAKRTLALASSGEGPPSKVLVTFATPIRVPGSTDYICHYRIEGLSCAGTRMAMGVDAVQALFLALANAASTLYSCEEHKAGRLTHLDEKNLGLPAYEKYFSESVPPPRDQFLV
jgi:hypothetical protein